MSLLPGEAFGRWLQANGRGHCVGAFSHRMHLACCSNAGLVADSEGNQTRGNLSDEVIHAKMHNIAPVDRYPMICSASTIPSGDDMTKLIMFVFQSPAAVCTIVKVSLVFADGNF